MINPKANGYAGDITPLEAWDTLKNDKNSLLVDVRSAAEWAYVGVVDLSRLDKETIFIEWKSFPEMLVNQNFVEQMEETCPDHETTIISLCRSGQRSIATSKALTKAGYKNSLNLLQGFEGDKNGDQHRSHIGGWKFCGLPWKQQ